MVHVWWNGPHRQQWGFNRRCGQGRWVLWKGVARICDGYCTSSKIWSSCPSFERGAFMLPDSVQCSLTSQRSFAEPTSDDIENERSFLPFVLCVKMNSQWSCAKEGRKWNLINYKTSLPHPDSRCIRRLWLGLSGLKFGNKSWEDGKDSSHSVPRVHPRQITAESIQKVLITSQPCVKFEGSVAPLQGTADSQEQFLCKEGPVKNSYSNLYRQYVRFSFFAALWTGWNTKVLKLAVI